MRKRTGRKAAAMALTSAMILSLLGGCGNGGKTAETSQEKSTSGEDPFQFDSVSDVKFPLKEKLTLMCLCMRRPPEEEPIRTIM